MFGMWVKDCKNVWNVSKIERLKNPRGWNFCLRSMAPWPPAFWCDAWLVIHQLGHASMIQVHLCRRHKKMGILELIHHQLYSIHYLLLWSKKLSPSLLLLQAICTSKEQKTSSSGGWSYIEFLVSKNVWLFLLSKIEILSTYTNEREQLIKAQAEIYLPINSSQYVNSMIIEAEKAAKYNPKTDKKHIIGKKISVHMYINC